MNDVTEQALLRLADRIHYLWLQGRYEEADREALRTPPGYEAIIVNATLPCFCVQIRLKPLQLPAHTGGQAVRTTEER